jgi:nucleoside-diphosphate-sugar epimerase
MIMLKHLNATAMQPARVVILGAGGFVGSTAAHNLRAKGIKTLEVTRDQVDLQHADAASKLTALLQAGDVLLIAAAIAPCKNGEQLLANIQMQHAICEAIKSKNADLTQVVYISSDAVYADDVALANEDSKMQPSSFHGMMHAARELMLKGVCGAVPLAILRPSVLYGFNDPHNGYGPNRFFRLANEEKNITLFGGGEELRDHIYVNDVAEIIAQTMLHRSHGALNVATGQSHSFKEIADKVVKLMAADVVVEATPRQNAITHRHFDITACRQAFPEFRYTTLDAGLALVQKEYVAQQVTV